MKSTAKIIRSLRAANLGSRARQHAYSGSGQWLHWRAPGGESILIGVAITLNQINYRQLPDLADIQPTVAALWGDTVAWQLGKLLDATAMALHVGNPLPEGISSEPIPFCRGDNPAQILDRLWRHGPAQSILLKKKPPSQLAERFNDGSTPAVAPSESAANNHAENDQRAAPASRGAKGQKK
ncbi:hypothetical protein JW897_12175 [Chromobacterium alkanivorans]|uniref:hypothetical protein n=1 Tax=Chromobacterium alkanivorans TaxID=1071719 RepID=UPI0019679ECD|nr:hypothetical protein [Chromobacterium alkanivorans]MBN3004492.1 hypothetical protein [Chromobacterium alkanivorans]